MNTNTLENNVAENNAVLTQTVHDYFQANDGLAQHLSVRVDEVSAEHAVASMPLTAHHINGLGTAHGGAIFSLADISFGAACFGAGLCCVTAQSSISFIAPGRVSPIRAEVRLIKAGSTLMIYSVMVFDGVNKLMAQGQITGYRVGTFADLQKRSVSKA